MTIDINRAAMLGRKSGMLSIVLGSLVFILMAGWLSLRSSLGFFQKLLLFWEHVGLKDCLMAMWGLVSMLLFEYMWGAWVGRRILNASRRAFGWCLFSGYLHLWIGGLVFLGIDQLLISSVEKDYLLVISDIGVLMTYASVFAFPAILIFSILRSLWFVDQRKRAPKVLW